jgi:superfamily II DNA or RNA helicase
MTTQALWITNMEYASKKTLQNPSLENLEDLKNLNKNGTVFSEIDCLRAIDSLDSAAEIMIALYMIGAKRFSGYLWARQLVLKAKLRKLDTSNTHLKFDSIDRYVAYNILDRGTYTESQIIKIVSFFPSSDQQAFEKYLKNAVKESIGDLNEIDPDLVRILIPTFRIQTDPRLLLASCRHRTIGNWLERLEIAYEKSPQIFSDEASVISKLKIDPSYYRRTILQIKALTGDPEALIVFLDSGQFVQFDNVAVITPTPKQIQSVVTQSFLKGGYSDHAFRLVRNKMGGEIPKGIIASASKSTQKDPELHQIVANYLESHKLWREFIRKMRPIPLSDISASNFKSLVIASKETHDFELTLNLHKHKDIGDNSLLSRCAAELINFGALERGVNLFDEVRDKPSTQGHQSNEVVFYKNLDGQGLIKWDLIRRINDPKHLLRIARHLSTTLSSSNEINRYLQRAIALNDPESASFFVELHPTQPIQREILDLAVQWPRDVIGKRELAKVHIRAGEFIKAKELATSVAEKDDQAAHLLMYVLNENVAEWAYKLYERKSEYSPEVYRKQFLSQGIVITPRYSALDNLELHRLIRDGAPKQSRMSRISQSRVEESWFCREAIGKFEGTGNWQTLSCNNHRQRTCDFHAEKMFPELDHISWSKTKEVINSESYASSLEGKPNLAKLLGRSEPRAWQKEAFNAWVSHGRHGIVEAATGSGKSMLGVMAALEAMDEGYAVVIVVPTRVLQQQWIKQYFLTLWDSPGAKIRTIGNIDGDYVRDVAQLSPGTITVAVAKSLRENPSLNPAEGVKSLIIADEVHNYTSEASQKMLSSNYSRRLGLTATLEPPQGRYPVLANFFGGDPVYRYDFSRAVKEKVISPYNLITIGVPLEKEIARLYTAAYVRMKNAKDQLLILGNNVSNPDSLNRTIEIFHSKGLHSGLIKEYQSAFEDSDNYLKDANSKAGAIRSITDFIKTRGNTIVFSDLIATARNIQIIFKERGLNSEVISAEVPQSEREAIFRKLKNKSICALLSPKALDEGVDIEQLSTGVFAGASRRRLQIIQRLGRVLRISENKQVPLLILIVADGTEEDPFMPDNESMQNSPFGIVCEQAVSKKHFRLEDDSEIRQYLSGLAIN